MGGCCVVVCEWMRPQKSKAGNTSHYKHNSLPGLAASVTGITLGELRDGLRFVGSSEWGQEELGLGVEGRVHEHVFGERCCLQIQ